MSTFDARALGALIGDDAARALARLADAAHEPATPARCAALIERLRHHPAVVATDLGVSWEGEPMTMLSAGAGAVSVLAWGYPHPDEPLGASALAWLIGQVADGEPALATRARFHVVLCADPDQARLNDAWTRSGDVGDLLGTVRPEHLERQVDYGFPVAWGPFEQPADYDGALACHIAAHCVDPAGCGPVCLRTQIPAGPYPESLALAHAMRLTRPDVVVAMHETVTGGAFTFLLERPEGALADRLIAIPEACGIPRHRGQKIDSGRPWRVGERDLIREPRLEAEARRFLRRPGVSADETYLGNVSAAMYLQSLAPGAQFMVPEAPHLTHPDFGDLTPLGDRRAVRAGWEERARGRRWCVRADMTMPDGTRAPVLYRMRTTRPAGQREGAQIIPVSVGMLGVEAIALRRWVFEATDALWRSLPAHLLAGDHILAREQRALGVRAGHVNDASLRIFRLSDYSDAPATRAHRADFRWRWLIETARRPARLARLIRDTDGPIRVHDAARALVDQLIGDLPPELASADLRAQAAVSQLARIVAVVDAVRSPGAAWAPEAGR